MSPTQLPLSLQIWKMTSRLRRGASRYVSEPPPVCLHAPHFTSTTNFFQKSQHNKIVYNDTLTFRIKKSILIEIKGFISVFLNFTNSLNCEEQLQGYNQDIKIKNLSAN